MQEFETDVLVIGFGGAGASAAIEAHDAGAQVIILEKMPQPGGNHYWVQIMLPGFVLGAITGFLTQRMGVAPKATRS